MHRFGNFAGLCPTPMNPYSRTPAMAIGVPAHAWSVEGMVGFLPN